MPADLLALAPSGLSAIRSYPFSVVERLRHSGLPFHLGDVVAIVYPEKRQTERRRARALRVLMEFVAAGLIEPINDANTLYQNRTDTVPPLESGQWPLRARIARKVAVGEHADRLQGQALLTAFHASSGPHRLAQQLA